MCCIGMLGERCVCAKCKLKRLQRERMVDGVPCVVCAFFHSCPVIQCLMCCGLSSVCQSCRRRQRCRPACLYYWLSLVLVSSCVVAVGSGVIVFVKVVVVVLCATGSHWFRCHRVWDNTSEPAVFNLKVRSSMLFEPYSTLWPDFTLEIDSRHRLWMVEEVSLIAWL
jgi:hypothetical protein